MKIEFSGEVDFGSLKVGDFFFDNYGKLCLKIPEEDDLNAVCLENVQENHSALYCFPNSCKCRKCEGKIIIE